MNYEHCICSGEATDHEAVPSPWTLACIRVNISVTHKLFTVIYLTGK